jgi:putative ABC transport system permease protein
MALQELRVNKLRTFLSLFGITIGIFCIIGVLATVDSLEAYVQKQVKSLGTNTIWIDKNDFSQSGPDYPFWKYAKRPTNKYSDMVFLKNHVTQAQCISYFTATGVSAEYHNNVLSGAPLYGVSEDFYKTHDIKIAEGRFISDVEFERGNPVCVMGNNQAESLFGTPENAVGKEVTINGRKVTVIGLIEKRGSEPIGFRFDDCMLVSYRYFASIFDVMKVGQNLIIAEAKNETGKAAMSDELKGYMRQLRKLKPGEADNFSLNDIQLFGDAISNLFGSISLGGFFIAVLSLVVGVFGVANIMFVTVRERTGQIGLKKAIGAKSRTILTEFLLESSFLCLMGGLMGLLFVWILALVLSSILPFPIFIAPRIIIIALSVCIGLGVLAGLIPAFIAAKMDPVVAIRTK